MFAVITVLPANSAEKLVEVVGRFDVSYLPAIEKVENGLIPESMECRLLIDADGDLWELAEGAIKENETLIVADSQRELDEAYNGVVAGRWYNLTH